MTGSWRRAESGGPQEGEAVMVAVSTQQHQQLEDFQRCQERRIEAAAQQLQVVSSGSGSDIGDDSIADTSGRFDCKCHQYFRGSRQDAR